MKDQISSELQVSFKNCQDKIDSEVQKISEKLKIQHQKNVEAEILFEKKCLERALEIQREKEKNISEINLLRKKLDTDFKTWKGQCEKFKEIRLDEVLSLNVSGIYFP